jgi:exosortase/archaeosortase family protein
MSLLSGHFFLKSTGSKILLLLAALPLLIVKNGLRIVTLSVLAIYVDPGFLTGELHRQGGVVFFLIALGILGLVLRLLQNVEIGRARRAAVTGPAAAEPDSATLQTRS